MFWKWHNKVVKSAVDVVSSTVKSVGGFLVEKAKEFLKVEMETLKINSQGLLRMWLKLLGNY